jgi:hypothetical protein
MQSMKQSSKCVCHQLDPQKLLTALDQPHSKIAHGQHSVLQTPQPEQSIRANEFQNTFRSDQRA